MAKALPRPSIQGPAFIRLLARLTDADLPRGEHALSERLSQWIDWTRAIALSRALDGRLPDPPDAAPVSASGEDAECARLHAAIVEAIADDAPAPRSAPAAADAGDYTVFRQRYLTLQRSMQTTTGHLRGRLRDRLAQTSPALARLAEIDAAMELALSPREQRLLAAVPTLLGAHFERLRAAAPDRAAVAGDAPEPWRELFRKDMRQVLLAELDVRFQPIEALRAALRTR